MAKRTPETCEFLRQYSEMTKAGGRCLELPESEMEYKCIKEMKLRRYGEGCLMTKEYSIVPIGSIWIRDDDENLIGGEVHLECTEGDDDLGWIEISLKDLEHYFELID